jgi:hypothetical protein
MGWHGRPFASPPPCSLHYLTKPIDRTALHRLLSTLHARRETKGGAPAES